MEPSVRERGAIRLRALFELLFIFLIAYAVIQIGPAVKLRIDFLNEMEVAAHAPVYESADEVKRELLEVAEGLGLTLFAENLYVERNADKKKTIITATYDLYINFWPRFTYVWHVKDQVEGYLL